MKSFAILAAAIVGAVLLQRPASSQENWSAAQAGAMLRTFGGAHLVRDREGYRTKSVALVNVGPTNAALALTAQLPAVVNLEVVALPYNNFDDRGLEYVGRMTQLEELQLVGRDLTDRGVASLSGLVNLQELSIDAPISDAGLAGLGALSRLRFLDLSGTRVRGTGFASLAGMEQLEILGLNGARTDNEGLAAVAGMASLRTLMLRRAQIDDRGLALVSALPNLQRLYLDETAVTEAGVANLVGSVDPQLMAVEGATQLRLLSLRGASQLRGDDLAGLANIYGLPFIERFDIQGTSLERDPERLGRLREAQRIADHWRNLQGYSNAGPSLRFDENLNLSGLYYVAPSFEPSGDTMDELVNYPPTTLQELSLRDAFLQDADLQDLAGLTGLIKLNLYKTGISDVGLTNLYPLKNLKHLYLDEGNTRVTQAGLDALREAIPGLEVVRLP